MKEYGRCPFGASTPVAFRKRFSEEDLAAILEASGPRPETEKKDDSDNDDPPNSGPLVPDAACCPVGIAYPQDIDLLNQAREKAEKTVYELCKSTGRREAPDVPQASSEGLSPPVQKRETRCENSCNTSVETSGT